MRLLTYLELSGVAERRLEPDPAQWDEGGDLSPVKTGVYQKDGVRIRYQEVGSGFPLFAIPGGGLNSRIVNWPNAVDGTGIPVRLSPPPILQLTEHYPMPDTDPRAFTNRESR